MERLRPQRIWLALFFFALVYGGAAVSVDAKSTPSTESDDLNPSRGGRNFDQCVRLAIQQSPQIKSGSLEIDVRRLDESDNKYAFIPSFSVRTRYYIDAPKSLGGDDQPYSLGFYTEPYNPFQTYFSLQASKMFTQIAVLSHLHAISGFIHRLGNSMLELESMSRMEALQDEVVALARQNVAYARNKMKSESLSPLELRLAEQELLLAEAEKEKIATSQRVMKDAVRGLLGLEANENLDLNVGGLRSEILNGFLPEKASLESARSNSYQVKIQKLKKELQALRIKLAYSKFLPTLVGGIDNGDPLSRSNKGDYFVFVGLEMPLWDGMKRANDVTRQKTIMKQFDAEEQTKEVDLANSWNSAQSALANASTGLQLAKSRQELSGLRKRQKEISYGEGRETFLQYLVESRGCIESKKITESKELEYAKAALALYALSGELSHRFVEASSY
ncbi:MAG: TolC family protein [Syntrophobacteraceae bacterium]